MKHTSLPSTLDIGVNYSAEGWAGYSFSGGGFFAGDIDEVTSKFGGHYSVVDIPELVSDRRKYLVLFNLAYFHAIMDTLTLIFRVQAVDPGILFVVYVDRTRVEISTVFSYMLQVLDANMVEYVVIETPANMRGTGLESVEHPLVSRVTNFSYPANFEPTLADVRNAFDRVLKFAASAGGAELDAPKGDRKVYLSRRKVGYVELPAEVASRFEYAGYTSDLRLSGESELEEYLSGLGFEIVCPEDFSSFEEQVRYMSGVEVLVSSTGSGLMNVGLMPSGGLVVELRCELLFGCIGGEWSASGPYQILIGEYADISYVKGHTHILVNAAGKEALPVIDALKKLGLKLFV